MFFICCADVEQGTPVPDPSAPWCHPFTHDDQRSAAPKHARRLAQFLSIAIRRDSRGVLELHNVRRSLEVLSASEAAKRSNRAALAAVGAAHDEVHRATEAITRYNSADVGIREALALASGNQMLALLLESLSESLHHSFAQGFSGFMDGGGNILDALAEHPRIYDLVAAGDPAGAARAMRQHLDSTARDLQVFLRGADSSS